MLIGVTFRANEAVLANEAEVANEALVAYVANEAEVELYDVEAFLA